MAASNDEENSCIVYDAQGDPHLHLFGIIKTVLEKELQLERQLNPGMTEKEVFLKVWRHQEQISQQYYTGETPQISYEDPACRMAYLLAYGAANARLIEQILWNTLSDWFIGKFLAKDRKERTLRICAYGGGPGTELLGIARLLFEIYHIFLKYAPQHEESDLPPNAQELAKGLILEFTLFEKARGWLDSWRTMRSELIGMDDPSIASIHGDFAQLDLIAPEFFNQGTYAHTILQADIHIFNYAVSEMFYQGEFPNVFAQIVERAHPGAYFIIADRREPALMDYVDKHLIGPATDQEALQIIQQYQHLYGNLPAIEDKMHLGHWLHKTAQGTIWWPKLKWESFYIVAQKLPPLDIPF